MSKTSTSSFSAVITALRFPLIIMVVAIHLISDKLTLPQWGAPNWLYIYVSEFLSHSLPRIAVPMFFFISGYYAFYKKDWSQRSIWTVELKKRVKTLLIPYLLWNSIYLVILLAKTQVGLRLGVGASDPFYITSFTQLLSYYWGDVIVYPLWYIRDLMVLCALGPILYQLLSWTRGYILLPLLVLFLIGWECGVAGFGTVSFFCFMLGGQLGTKQIDPLEAIQRVAAGENVLAPDVTRTLITVATDAPAAGDPSARALVAALTEREREVAVLMTQGLTNNQIGTRLHLSLASVKSHLTSLFVKLGVDNRVSAAMIIRDAGL